MSYLTLHTPLGELTVFEEDGAIVALDFGRAHAPDGLPPPTALLREAATQLHDYFDGTRTVFDLPELAADVEEEIEIMIKYEGYISRQMEQVEKMNRLEQKKMPADIVYADIDTLSAEARQKLDEIRPLSLGQASRISGVSPADITALLIVLEQHSREEKNHVSQ